MFTQGQSVISNFYGKGIIERVYSEESFTRPIIVLFDNSPVRQSYHTSGIYDTRGEYARFDARNIKLT